MTHEACRTQWRWGDNGGADVAQSAAKPNANERNGPPLPPARFEGVIVPMLRCGLTKGALCSRSVAVQSCGKKDSHRDHRQRNPGIKETPGANRGH